MSDAPDLLPRWAEKVRDEMHEQDKRIVRLETTNKVLYLVIGVFLILAGMVVTIVLSKDHEEKAQIEYVRPKNIDIEDDNTRAIIS